MKGSPVKTPRSRVLGIVMLAMAAAWTLPSPAWAESDVDDAKLASFVTAARAVHEVIKEASGRISQIQNDEEADQLRAEIDAQAEAVINGTEGITIEEYREIHTAARTDPELSERITAMFNAPAMQ